MTMRTSTGRRGVKRQRMSDDEDENRSFSIANTNVHDVTDTINRLCQQQPAPISPLPKTERMVKWYKKKLFWKLIDCSERRSIDIFQRDPIERSERSSDIIHRDRDSHLEEARLIPFRREGVLLKDVFAQHVLLLLNGEIWCKKRPKPDTSNAKLYICLDYEGKKHNKGNNNKWLICLCRERAPSPSHRRGIEIVNQETIATVLVLLWEKKQRYYIIADFEFVSGYMEMMTSEVYRYLEFRDFWESAIKEQLFFDAKKLEALLQQRKKEKFGPDFRFPLAATKVMAPCGVANRNNWCSLYAYMSMQFNFSLEPKEAVKVLRTQGSTPDHLRPSPDDVTMADRPEVEYAKSFSSFFDV